jgi:hypothetical protein
MSALQGRRAHPIWQAAFGAAFARMLANQCEVPGDRLVPPEEAARTVKILRKARVAAIAVADAAVREALTVPGSVNRSWR